MGGSDWPAFNQALLETVLGTLGIVAIVIGLILVAGGWRR